MNATRPRRGIIRLIAKAHEALAELSAHANKIERAHNLSAARALTQRARSFMNEEAKGIYLKSKEAVRDCREKPKRKPSARQLKSLQETRNRKKQIINK